MGDQSIADAYPKVKALLRRTEDRPYYQDVRDETKAYVYLWFYQLVPAEEFFRKSLHANPSSEWGLPSLSICLSYQGKFSEAIQVGQQAVASNPVSLFCRHTLAIANMLAGNYAEAHEHGQKALALNPHHVHSLKILAQNYTLQRQFQEAIDLLMQALRNEQIDDRDPYLLGRLGVAYALQGDRQSAEGVIRTMRDEYGKKRRHFDYFIAMIYQALGQTERALDWLEKAYSNLEGELNWVHQDPEFASLRTHPRYRSLAQQMKDRYRALTF